MHSIHVNVRTGRAGGVAILARYTKGSDVKWTLNSLVDNSRTPKGALRAERECLEPTDVTFNE